MASEEEKNRKSLNYSLKDGVFSSLMLGFTQDYFTPFLLLVGGTVRHVGMINALPNLIASLIQLKSADFSERLKSRKKVIDIFVFLQGLMLLPMIASFMFGSYGAAFFIAIVTLFTSFGAIVAPAWGSLMADIVQDDRRGEYFGWRNTILGFVNIIATFAAGYILSRSDGLNIIFWGFAVVFGVAFAFRMVSWWYLTRMHEPKLLHRQEDYFSLWDFVARSRKSNFARFVFFVSALKFSVNVAAPFFAVIMISDLKFDYLTYTAINLAATLSANFTIKRWGIHSDKVGNLKVVRLTARLIALVPLLWLLNQNAYFLFAVQLFSGFAWAGFNLAASNFIYDASSPGKRTRCIAYFNFFNGISLCFGALLGGYLAQVMPQGPFAYSLMGIVLLSALLRIMVSFFLPFNLKEVREVESIRSHQLFLRMFSTRTSAEKEN